MQHVVCGGDEVVVEEQNQARQRPLAHRRALGADQGAFGDYRRRASRVEDQIPWHDVAMHSL